MASDPTLVESDEDFDYLENTCLTGETRCVGANHFVREDLTELRNTKDAMAMPEGTFFSFCTISTLILVLLCICFRHQ